jgi:hypothetical protein
VRRWTAGNGSDSTTAALAYRAANRGSLRLPNLYVIRTAPQFAGHPMGKTFLLTEWPSPIVWSVYGTFKPANISRGQIESKEGLESQTLDVTWFPQSNDILAVDGSGNTLLTALQGFGGNLSDSIFDNAECEVWEATMMPGGDCDTLGATCLFGGRIGNAEPDAMKCKFSVTSRMEAFNTQVPTVVIEAGNVTAQYLPGQVPSGAPASLTVVSGSTPGLVLATATGSTPAGGVYDSGYLVFTSGQLAGFSADIVMAGPASGSPGTWAFALELPLPFLPAVGDVLTGYIYASATPAFPYVPSSINSAMLTG